MKGQKEARHDQKPTTGEDLRQSQTEAETFVWRELRGRRFAGYKFRRQVPLGSYIVDFLCLDRRVIVELDGGHHNQSSNRSYDSRRDGWLRAEGFEVLRFWNSDVFLEWEGMAERIWLTLQNQPSRADVADRDDVCRKARGKD